jgi:predicted DNA-binding transcriptional regulator AlpA
MQTTTITTAPKLKPAGAPLPASLSGFDSLPDSALISVGVVAALLGSSANTVWRRAKAGTLPAPVKTGQMSTRWKVGAIRAYLASLEA